ncbi:MAG: PBP1A family penicillin-binding protein [Lachnospiraceae bacterium]|nr:PBP1A family penicillin-binding protein [Lachnospiraceae bacterium]
MDYSKKGTARKHKKMSSDKARMRHRFFLIFGKTLLIIFFAFIIIGCCAAFGIYRGVLASAPDIDEIDVSPTGYLSTIYDDKGKEIDTLIAAGANRQYVTIDEIPKNLQHAFVAIEDERFYEHNGIDLKGILRAGFRFVATMGKSRQGASTITQQLLKNNVFTDWVNEESLSSKIKRKIQEQYLAVQLEKKVNNKDWILENYLNTINLGQNSLGVQSAAERYFGKDVSDLTLSECAVIAAITQNPSGYNPISYPENNKKRMQKTLENMLKFKYITQEEYDKAMKDDVYARIQKVNTEHSNTNSNSSYFVDELVEQVTNDLITLKGYTETQAYKMVYSGGLQIYSTQSSDIQSICEKTLSNSANYPTEQTYINWYAKYQDKNGEVTALTEQNILKYYQKKLGSSYSLDYADKNAAATAIEGYKNYMLSKGGTFVKNTESVKYIPQPQASVTIMDQSTGEVKALVGGRGDKEGSMTLNRASNTYRQPGSTFKVLSAYAPALDTGGKTLASVQDDAPTKKTDGSALRNYDGTYRGFTTYREAIEKSINVVAVKTLADITPQVGYDYLLNFGFTSLSNQDIVQVLCLGGITKGVSNLELTAAYATIANAGTYTKPRFYTKILDHEGNVLIDNTPQTHTVLKETTAWLLTDAMKGVVTRGTGVRCNFQGQAIAGKSGTTSNNRDAWFAGYTPYYTCVVWGGYDDNKTIPSTGYVKDIWKIIMSQTHAKLSYKDFTKPKGIVSASICKKSGLLAVDGVCSRDPRGSCVKTEYFASGTVPTTYCNHHVAVKVCAESGKAAGPDCTNITTRIFITGGSKGTADSAYLLPGDFESHICDIHKQQQETEEDTDEEDDTDDSESPPPSEEEEED